MAVLAAVETPDWVWFEDGLAYDNARLSQALIADGHGDATRLLMSRPGLRSLRWLMALQTAPTGCFRPVGTEEFRRPRQYAACLRPAAGRGGRDHLGLPCGVARRTAMRMAGQARCAPSPGFSAAMTCRWRWSTCDSGQLPDGLHPDRANENKGGESVLSYLLGLVEIRQLARVDESARRNRAHSLPPSSPESQPTHSISRGHLVSSHVPQPAGPVSAPRSRAGRSCAPSSRRPSRGTSTRPTRPAPTTSSTGCWGSIREAAASQLADVLENFDGRHRNLLDTFEARAAEMEDAFAPHAAFTKTQRQLVGAYFLQRIFVRGLGPVQSEHRPRIPTSPARRKADCASS